MSNIKSILLLFFSFLVLASCSKKIIQNKVLSDLKELSDDKYEGRKTDTKGAAMAADYIIKRFTDLKLVKFNNSFKMPFSFKQRSGESINGVNVVGYIKGKSDQVMVISAHYDHIGVIDGKVFNGADDDASGVAAVLAFAEYYSKNQPQHTLIFTTFDAEEMGLQGSKYFVANPPVALDKIKININLDMISRNDKNELYACGTFRFPDLKKYLFTTSEQSKILFGHDDPKLGNDDWTFQSDQGSFFAKKIPFIYFGVEDHKDYHKETDEFQNINQEFYLSNVQAILDIIKNVDQGYSLQDKIGDSMIMN
jgi:Zn-dependent M28 family amino/carboxypeptidase